MAVIAGNHRYSTECQFIKFCSKTRSARLSFTFKGAKELELSALVQKSTMCAASLSE